MTMIKHTKIENLPAIFQMIEGIRTRGEQDHVCINL